MGLTTVQTLERGLARIERGWMKGDLVRKHLDGVDEVITVCALGSFLPEDGYRSGYGDESQIHSCTAVHCLADAAVSEQGYDRRLSYLKQWRKSGYSSLKEAQHMADFETVVSYNDRHKRTKAQMVKVFRRAIEIAKQREQAKYAKVRNATEADLVTAGD